jgi:hypothetical protein
MDIPSTIIFIAVILVLVAPIVEIAVKRPKIFLEMNAGTRAFAEAPLREVTLVETAEDREDAKIIPNNGSQITVTHSGQERLAA